MDIKKILMSGGMLVFVAAVVAGGTGAFFTDTETSAGNVFTAGDVNIDLGTITHNSLSTDATPFELGNNGNVIFPDMKPLDWGEVTGEITNTGNPAYICTRATVVTQNNPFDDMLKFRVNQGGGLSFAQTVGLAGQWLPLNGGQPVATDGVVNDGIEYCFGNFVAGDPNDSNNNGDCVLDPNATYNDAQNQVLEVDIEYYAIQSRNNADFDCSSLNGPTVTEVNGWPTVAGVITTETWKAEGRYGDGGGAQTWEIGVGNDTQGSAQQNTDFAWPNDSSVPFIVNYDASTGTATFDVDGEVVTHVVGANTGSDVLYFVARGTDGVGSVELTNLTVNGDVITPSSVLATDGPQSLEVSGVDLTQNFTASGDVTFTWSGTPSGSALGFQVVVGN